MHAQNNMVSFTTQVYEWLLLLKCLWSSKLVRYQLITWPWLSQVVMAMWRGKGFESLICTKKKLSDLSFYNRWTTIFLNTAWSFFYSFVSLFIYSFIHWFIHSFIHLFIYHQNAREVTTWTSMSWRYVCHDTFSAAPSSGTLGELHSIDTDFGFRCHNLLPRGGTLHHVKPRAATCVIPSPSWVGST